MASALKINFLDMATTATKSLLSKETLMPLGFVLSLLFGVFGVGISYSEGKASDKAQDREIDILREEISHLKNNSVTKTEFTLTMKNFETKLDLVLEKVEK